MNGLNRLLFTRFISFLFKQFRSFETSQTLFESCFFWLCPLGPELHWLLPLELARYVQIQFHSISVWFFLRFLQCYSFSLSFLLSLRCGACAYSMLVLLIGGILAGTPAHTMHSFPTVVVFTANSEHLHQSSRSGFGLVWNYGRFFDPFEHTVGVNPA